MESLKNCPFCGGKALIHYDKLRKINGSIGFWYFWKVRCENDCEAFNGMLDTREKAIEAWNRRAG